MVKKYAQRLKVIKPHNRLDVTPLGAARKIVIEFINFREHVLVLFQTKFQAKHHGSRLGTFWNYFFPIVPLIVYFVLGETKVFAAHTNDNNGIYICVGVTFWFMFAACLQIPIQTVQASSKEVMRAAVPLSVSIFSDFFDMIFETLVRSILILVMCMIFSDLALSKLGLFLILLPIPIFFFTAVGLILSIMNIVLKDIDRIVRLITQYGILISGVIFPTPSVAGLNLMNEYNPFYIFIEILRSTVFGHTTDLWWSLLVLCFLTALLVPISLQLFYKTEYWDI